MRKKLEVQAFFNAQEEELNKLAIQAMEKNGELNSNRVSLYVQFIRFAQKTAGEIANSYR